jgi:hypothetical protein
MNEPDFTGPEPQRVAARAIAMSVVTCRGFIEHDAVKAAEFWARTQQWFDALGIYGELEEWEREAVATPLGALEPHLHAKCQWLCEGLVVLAWALNRHKLPRHDAQVVAADVSRSVGFLEPRGSTVLARPTLRSAAEITKEAQEAFTVHWRLREFSLTCAAMNLREFLPTAWFGPLQLSESAFVDDDLAIKGVAIASASEQDVRVCTSIAFERHRAANWLRGGAIIYSETDTST